MLISMENPVHDFEVKWTFPMKDSNGKNLSTLFKFRKEFTLSNICLQIIYKYFRALVPDRASEKLDAFI